MENTHSATKEYKLRNEPNVRFTLELSCEGAGTQGAVCRAHVARNDGLKFRVEVRFEGEYASTKPDFDAECYLETALSLVQSQIESHRLEDTQIVLQVNSGLPRTKVGAALGDW